MSVSIIDGTIESIEAGKKQKKFSIFNSIVFREKDGTSRTIKKALVSNDLLTQMTVGNRGRFYSFATFEIRGIHAIRNKDGTAVYDYPGKFQALIYKIMVAGALGLIAIHIIDKGAISLLGVALSIFGTFGLYVNLKTSRETRAQFDADAAWKGDDATT
jgi:hypothetical protein